jgi:predicted acylesterase/phospholipase RssA
MTTDAPLTRDQLLAAVAAHREAQGARACVAVVLHPGGACGAYQAGALQALAEAGLRPDLLVGTSIGAFNGLGAWLDAYRDGGSTLARLWRRLGHRGHGSRLLLDKPYLLGWLTGRPGWPEGLGGGLAHAAGHPCEAWADLRQGLFTTDRLEAFTCRTVARALGLPLDAPPDAVGGALAAAAAEGHAPDLVVVATDVAAHAPVALVLGNGRVAARLGTRGWEAHVLGRPPLAGAAVLEAFYASASIPAVFPPRELLAAGRPLVDGVIGNHRPFQLAVDAGATLVVSLEVETAHPTGPYPVAHGAHFAMAAAEAFMTVGDHFVRDSARELALVNRALSRASASRPLVVPLYRLAPAARRLGLLEFDGRYEAGELAVSLYDDFMVGYAEAGGNDAARWHDYMVGHARHGDRGVALLAQRTGAYHDATFVGPALATGGTPALSG